MGRGKSDRTKMGPAEPVSGVDCSTRNGNDRIVVWHTTQGRQFRKVRGSVQRNETRDTNSENERPRRLQTC